MMSTNANEVEVITQNGNDTTTPARSRRRSKTARQRDSGASKIELARKIFARMGGKKPRKEVIEAFMSEAGLTQSGAATYYQRFASEGTTTRSGRRSRGKQASTQRSTGKRGRPIGSTSPNSKAEVARNIFKRMGGKKPRKEVIEALINEAKLTPSGASTYYQKMKSAA